MAKTSLIIPGMSIFNERQGETQWPTMRGAKLDEKSIAELKKLSSLVFCQGRYETNLNKYWHVDPMEDFVMWESEFRVKVPNANLAGAQSHVGVRSRTLYLLCWVGNYHYGSIFHCGWQFPHALAHIDTDLVRHAFLTFKRVADCLYADESYDARGEVYKFITKNLLEQI